ncbi:MAG: DUF1624 domain-containing protein [Deltaproteobacteria bacterium]|jgi:uncharacterized membrane protein|nr:DUF1624 domain-containing protein [Deltaproteobacteria bacterium]
MAETQNLPPTVHRIPRLPAIDTMRGIVMVLMAMDHASHAFNAHRYTADSFMWYQAGADIPVVQFLVRWVTHLCAPTFLFLAGFVLALSVSRRLDRGDPQHRIDREILIRGIFILLLDPFWMSFGFGGNAIFQVLFAIGASFCLMVPLRRLNLIVLGLISCGLFFFGEGLAQLVAGFSGTRQPGPGGALLIIGLRKVMGVYVLYPLLPWLAYMILGWVCGTYMLGKERFRPVGFFTVAGVVSLMLFLIVRGLNQFGNMWLYRYDLSIPQWLHVSKYPPSLSFAALELGIMFLILAFLFAWYRQRKPSPANPLQVFGRTPLFFYILHVHLLALGAWALKLHRAGGLVETGLATLAVLMVLYPLCRRYDRLKRAHPKSILRLV